MRTANLLRKRKIDPLSPITKFNMKSIYLGLIYILITTTILIVIVIPKIADSKETYNVLNLGVIIITVIVYFLFIVVRRFSGNRISNSLLINGILLFLLSELIFSMLNGEFSLFGILYKVGVLKHSDADVVRYRTNRDFFFSIAFLASAFITIAISKLLSIKSKQSLD